MLHRVLITDVDNTLFSWIDYFAPCFRAMVHAVAREGKLSEDELYDSFQVVFQREGSVEYRRAIQENLLVQSMAQEMRDRLLHVGVVAFGQTQRRHLRPYTNVKATLSSLRADGVRIVAVTNSGALQATYRIRQLGLSKLLDGMIAWDHDVAGVADSEESYDATVVKRAKASGLPWVRTLPLDKLKPNVEAYLEALELLRLAKAEMWVIGDSLHKDLSNVEALGGTSVWARYGHGFVQKNFDTLVRITHWSEERIRSTYDTGVLVPDHTVDDFSELLPIIGLRQGKFF
jgi:FMN phosphatase YigB (HAD superfamily)